MSSVIFQDKKTVFVVPMDLGSNPVIRNFFISCKMLKDETKTKEEGNSLSQTFLLPIFISNETEVRTCDFTLGKAAKAVPQN